MISQTIEYALRAMAFLAMRDEPESVASQAIAGPMRIPPGYLSKVLRDLVLAGLVRSVRGPNGGFSLARAAASIRILDIVNAVDPIRRITTCPLGNPAHLRLCPLHARLDRAIAHVEREFAETSLADILPRSSIAGHTCASLTALTTSAPRARLSPPPKSRTRTTPSSAPRSKPGTKRSAKARRATRPS